MDFESYVHPSVTTMAQTLPLGVTIVYIGDPLIDLSLGVSLRKLLRKKKKIKRNHVESEQHINVRF